MEEFAGNEKKSGIGWGQGIGVALFCFNKSKPSTRSYGILLMVHQ